MVYIAAYHQRAAEALPSAHSDQHWYVGWHSGAAPGLICLVCLVLSSSPCCLSGFSPVLPVSFQNPET